ncbi:hypothetical protein ACIRJO_18505 [Streptomyces sp. NPDC102394]|uniref:hypothetical protein n=1 Tax=Streptomyces sp. NPDC102394 TaxID=3366167 RepID=UPI003804CD0E
MAGTVVTCGDGAAAGLIGARVLVDLAEYDGPGPDARPADVLRSERNEGFAEYVVVPSARAHSVDGSPLTDVELAALPIAYGTVLAVLDRGSVSMTATGRRATTLLPDPSGEPRGCRTRM